MSYEYFKAIGPQMTQMAADEERMVSSQPIIF